MKGSNPAPPEGRRPKPPKNPPNMIRGEDYMETLPDVCSKLYPHALAWRDCVFHSNVDRRGIVHGHENREEIEVLDKFIEICKFLGFDKE